MLTQGVLYAIGGSMLYWPTLIYLGEWFIKRKGLALGITFAGIGAGGVAIPLVMDWALHRYGVKTALQIWAVSLVVLTAPPLYFVKSRIPPTFEGRTAWNKGIDLSFLEQPIFWFMEIGNVFQGIGLFIPIIFLPSMFSIDNAHCTSPPIPL
ncbi:MAG: hypothetical protein L6R40_000791 [Gallowayella cf. fulva]|nr:MAG: hypothetical protein L6R40_000791 [Xanthomendoza cf. fulva]